MLVDENWLTRRGFYKITPVGVVCNYISVKRDQRIKGNHVSCCRIISNPIIFKSIASYIHLSLPTKQIGT